MASRLTAAQQRYLDNATLIAAMSLIFSGLEKAGITWRLLGDIADTTSGGTPDRGNSTYYGGYIPWVKSGELEDGLIEHAEETITPDGLRNSSAKIYPKGTLVVALYGATVGKTGILALDAASNQAVCAVTPKAADVTARYLYWYLRHKRPDFLGSSFGGAQPNISQKVLRETTLPLPPVELQDVIDRFLSAVDVRQRADGIGLPALPVPIHDVPRIVARIEALARRVEEARGLRQEAAEALWGSAASDLFNRYNTAPKRCIGDFCEVRGGLQKSPARTPRYHPTPYLTVAHVQRNRVNVGSDLRYFEVAPEELERWRLKYGDLLIIEGNGSADQIGRVALFRNEIENCVHQNHVIRARPDLSAVDPEYLNAYLNSPLGQDEVQRRSRTTSGLRTLSVGRIQEIEVPLPALSDQRQVVRHLNQVEAKTRVLQGLQSSSQTIVDALMPSILAKAFAGEL